MPWGALFCSPGLRSGLASPIAHLPQLSGCALYPVLRCAMPCCVDSSEEARAAAESARWAESRVFSAVAKATAAEKAAVTMEREVRTG